MFIIFHIYTMALNPTYTIHIIPKSCSDPSSWATLVAKQKALRLLSLLTAPESFSSTYEREIVFTWAEWEARLQHPFVYTLVAVKTPSASNDSALQDLIDGEWVGCSVLLDISRLSNPSSSKTEIAEKSNLAGTFEINGLFVSPEARGHGLGGALIEASISHAQGVVAQEGDEKVLVRALVRRGNEQALKLYGKMKFAARHDPTMANSMTNEDSIILYMDR